MAKRPIPELEADLLNQSPMIRASSFVADLLDTARDREAAVDRGRVLRQNLVAAEADVLARLELALAQVQAFAAQTMDDGDGNEVPVDDATKLANIEAAAQSAVDDIAALRAAAAVGVRP
jgi:hypothetical protein